MNTYRLLFFTALSVLLYACGFQLKGQTQQHPKIHAIYLECDCDDTLATSIVTQLQDNDIQLISDAGTGLAVMVSDQSERTFNTATGDNEQSKEVELTLGFTVRITRDNALLGERRIESSTYVQYNSDTYLGSSSEAAESRDRLRRENADKLIRYISSLSDAQPK